MTFSIIIPTYNGEEFVEKALLSALRQTRKADEIIISDDHSSDKTLEICRKYEGESVKIYEHPEGPSGFVKGWNNGIKLAQSEYISILHQDDLLYPDFLESAEKAFQRYPQARHLFAPCDIIDKNGNVTKSASIQTRVVNLYSGREYACLYRGIEGHIHRCPGVITHRDIFKQCPYREEAGHIADDDFFYRVSEITDVIGVMRPLAGYRVHGLSETGKLKDLALNLRLMHDYKFQLDHISPSLSDRAATRTFFLNSLWRHSKRVLGYSLKNFKPAYLKAAVGNMLYCIHQAFKGDRTI